MKDRILILTGGQLEENFLKQYLEEQKEAFSFIICADRGLEAADKVGLKVDGIVGDFDSLKQKELLKKYQAMETKVEIRSFVPEKDWTDTHLAIDFALEKNPKEIVILGATGTRVDHLLGNLNLLMMPAKKQIPAYIIDPWNKIYLLYGETEYVIRKEKAYGRYVSVIPFTPMAEHVTLEGFKYPLRDVTMTMGNSLGISNEIVDKTAKIKLNSGYLLIIESDDTCH